MNLGAMNSQGRTRQQTEAALFWQNGPELAYYSVLDQLTAQMQVGEAARAYALVATAVADSRIAALFNKWEYRSWRPITSIRLGNGVGWQAVPDWVRGQVCCTSPSSLPLTSVVH